jgi:S-adenosylhomocysteine hydrolase
MTGIRKLPATTTKTHTGLDAQVVKADAKPKVDAKPKAEAKPKTAVQSDATFVKASADAPVDVRMGATQGTPTEGATKASALHASSLGATLGTTPTNATVAMTSEQRMMHLLGRGPVAEPSKAPKPAVLEKAVLAKIGPQAEHMSALEVATALGAPSWADAIHAAGLCAESAGKQPHWLLAAHLSKWMAGIAYEGAPLSDVAASFMAAHPDVKERFPYLDGAFVATLQQAYPFMPQWQASPSKVKELDDWTSLELGGTPDAYLSKLDMALTQLAEVPLTMALTSAMAETLVDKQPFKDANVVMVQHMLGQANPLVDAMTRAGMDVTRAEYVGVPYQKGPAVKATLEQGHGVKVTVPEQGNIDDMWRVITEAVDRAYARHLENGAPILVMDDGGYASKYIAEKYADKAHLFKVVEQTTRGLTEISKLPSVPHAVVDVAGSYGKRFESAQVGDAVKMAVRRVLDAVTTTPARKDVLVVGAGKVGEGVADSFAGDGARITIFDPFITPGRKKELEKKGFTIITDKEKALDKKFLVIGCSGHRSIDMADFAKMSSPVFLASASSKRVEIDTIGLGELATDKEGQLRKILAAKVNEQETWHYFLQDGRIVTAMADGLPVNFQAVNSIAPELIDHTMALMLLGAAQAMDPNNKPGLNALDPNAQFWLQAKMEGLRDVTDRADGVPKSDGDFELQSGDRTFAGTKADWMRIATSPATPPAVLHDLFVARFEVDAMDPIALAILASKHDVLDKTVDFAIEKQCLPYMGRMLQNESLTDAQEDKILSWLEQSFWAAVGMDKLNWTGEKIDVVKHRAVAVEGSEATGWKYLYADLVQHQNGEVYLAHRVSSVADAVKHQTSDLLFGHPRSPAYLREALLRDTYGLMSHQLASNVIRLRHPSWTGEELDKMFRDVASVAYSKSISSKSADVNYAYDLIEAMRDHPSASESLQQRADEILVEIRKTIEQRTKLPQPRGVAGWQMTPLGIPLPEYN